MFQYICPQFEKKRLLRVEMLEQLRDYPANLLKISFQDFQNGFLKGSRITWSDGILSIEPGVILFEGHLYCMEESYQMECHAMDKLRFLKIYFEKVEKRENGLYGDTKIVLDEKETDPNNEIELCRFRLQEGARLRCNYECFEDFSTEYDTVNITHVPFAGEGESTLSPLILKEFAKEMLQCKSGDAVDISFSMNILAAGGRVSRDYLNAYIYLKTDERVNQLEDIYKTLLKILSLQASGKYGLKPSKQDNRRVMLL